MKELNVLIAGVGGQGGVLLSRIISLSAVKEGLRVLISESRGGAQRGGRVISQIRIGTEVYSPLIPANGGDVLLGLEPMEALRTAYGYLKEDGVVLLNTNPVLPVLVQMGSMEYPSINSIVSSLRKITNRIITIEAANIAERAGNRMATNIVMLGALAATGILPVREETILQTLVDEVPKWTRDVNLRAFNLGLSELKRKEG